MGLNGEYRIAVGEELLNQPSLAVKLGMGAGSGAWLTSADRPFDWAQAKAKRLCHRRTLQFQSF
jgi:hypothetical protein